MAERSAFHGQEVDLRTLPGARVLRVVHTGRQEIEAHRHDWSYLALFTLGDYSEAYDGGEADVAGPTVVFHPAGRPHANLVRDAGLETLALEFDRSWLRRHGVELPLDRSLLWKGGLAAQAARALRRSLTDRSLPDKDVAVAAARFLRTAQGADTPQPPSWLRRVEKALRSPQPPCTRQLARQLDLHPAWMARAYRAVTGEGIHETVRRRRVEEACALLRRSDSPLCEVALAAGFCDQSHMNRAFRALLGRTPLDVRQEGSDAPRRRH